MLPGPNQTPARFSEVYFPSRSSNLSSRRLIHSTRYLYPLLLIRTNHSVSERDCLESLADVMVPTLCTMESRRYPPGLSDGEWRCISPHLPGPTEEGRRRLHCLRA